MTDWTLSKLLELARQRELEQLETFWKHDFDSSKRLISEMFTEELTMINPNSLSALTMFLRLSISEIDLDPDIRDQIHTFLLFPDIFSLKPQIYGKLTFFLVLMDGGYARLNSHIDHPAATLIEQIGSQFKACIETETFDYSALSAAFESQFAYLQQEDQQIHPISFQMLAHLLNYIAITPNLESSSFSSVNGPKFFDETLSELCTTVRWPHNHVTQLVHCLTEVQLTNQQLVLVAEKVETLWSTMKLEEIPPLVYQLLLLSNKGARSLIFGQIISYFNGLADTESMDMEVSRQIESTVIVHIFDCARNNKVLGHHWVTMFKSGKYICLSPFTLGVLLALSRNTTYQKNTIDYLKSSILNYYQEINRYAELPVMYKVYTIGSLKEVFHTLVDRSPPGGDLAIQGLLELLVEILDTQPKMFWKAALGNNDDHLLSIPSIPQNGPITPLAQSHRLAHEILCAMFKKFDVLRRPIMDKVINRLRTKTQSLPRYLELMTSLVRQGLHPILPMIPMFTDTLTLLPTLSIPLAKVLLRGWQPIIIHSSSFLDSLMMVLRKGLFIRSINERLVSLNGLLFVLEIAGKNLIPQPNSSNSRLQAEAKDELHPLVYEIMGILRRCLIQPAEIRMALYDGLMNLTFQTPQLALPIIEFLGAQLTKYIDSKATEGSINPPLDLGICRQSPSSPQLVEPLPNLLCSLVQGILANQDKQQEWAQKLLQISHQMISVDLASFGLDNSVSLSMDNPEGLINNVTSSLLLGVYEGLFNLQVLIGDDNLICGLYSRYSDVFRIVSTKATDAKGRHLLKSGGGLLTTHLQLSTASVLLNKFGLDHDFSNGEESLLDYLISVVHYHIINQQPVNCKEEKKRIFASYYELLATLSRKLIFSNGVSSIKTPHTLQFGWIALNRMIDWLHSNDSLFTTNIYKLFKELSDGTSLSTEEANDDTLIELTFFYVSEILRQIPSFTQSSFLHLLNVVNTLIDRIILPSRSRPDTEEKSWASKHQLSLNHLSQALGEKFYNVDRIDGGASAKAWCQVFYHLAQLTNDYQPFEQLMLSVQRVSGRISRESDEDGQSHSPGEEQTHPIQRTLGSLLRTQAALGAIITLTLHSINQRLDVMGWALTHITHVNDVQPNLRHITLSRTSTPLPIEQKLAIEVTSYTNALATLTRTTLPHLNADQLLDSLQCLYKLLVQLSKYRIKHGLPTEDCLLPLLEKVEATLGDGVSGFMNYCQSSNFSENPSKAKKATSKKGTTKPNSTTNSTKGEKRMANLTLYLESFELHLYQLYKHFKITPRHNLRRSTVRDFRINKELFLNPRIDPELQEEEEEEEEEDPKAQLLREMAMLQTESEPGLAPVTSHNSSPRIKREQIDGKEDNVVEFGLTQASYPGLNQDQNVRKVRRLDNNGAQSITHSQYTQAEEEDEEVDVLGEEEEEEDHHDQDRYDSDMIDDS